MGAWLLGATMNAVMTWWAVSLTLLNHDFGNEVLSREKLLLYVPIFVAILVWLTRILFIGAFSVAGEHLFDLHGDKNTGQSKPKNNAYLPKKAAPSPARTTSRATTTRTTTRPPTRAPQPARASTVTPIESVVPQPKRPLSTTPPKPKAPSVKKVPKVQSNKSRVRQRPPMPSGGVRRTPVKSYQAKQR